MRICQKQPIRITNEKTMSFLDEVKYTEDGLVPAIAQDAETGKVLMFAWMNRESLQLTVEKQEVVYYSRSRKQLWHKGETSGHTQKLKELRIDCDNDVILLSVEQIGGIACHTGRESCMFRRYEDGEWKTVEDVVKSPEEIYGDK